ncbi:MAG: hypothetical protein PHV13_00975 [Candidatus ainarchaeum sp.]|nr:hypothetical protein [Candidatus ainarchaeum sp.]
MKPLKELASSVLLAFRKHNQRRLRKLNDDILVEAAMNFTPVYFNMAIFSYVLAKIVSKPRFLGRDYEAALHEIENALQAVSDTIDTATHEESLAAFSVLEKSIASLEQRDPRFVVDLVTKGKLKMAATLYAQGMSLGVASDMTGMEKQEILDYAGETMMFDRMKEEKPIAERMKFARKLIEE